MVHRNYSNTGQAFWVGVGSFSNFAVGIISAAIFSRYFDKVEYGTYRQILYVYNTLLVVFTAGLPRVFSYYLPRYDLSQGKDIVWKITKVLFLCGLAFSIFLYVFSGLIADILKNPELSKGLKWFSPIPMLILPTLGIEGIFSTYKMTKYIAVYNTLTRGMMLFFITFPVILLRGTYLQAIYGWIFVSIIALIIAYFFKGIPFKGVINEESNLPVKEIFKYSMPIALASIAGIADSASNQFYISRYFGPEVFAEFSNGFIQVPFVGMITGATATVLMPMLSKMVFLKSDREQLLILWRSALQKSMILIYPIVIFCMFYSKEIISIVFSDAYIISAKYFITAMTINFFNVIMVAPLLYSLGETKFIARLAFTMAITSWLFGYLMLIIFKTPLSIAIMYVILSVGYILVAFGYAASKIGVSIKQLFPVARCSVIALHSIIALLVIKSILALMSLQVSTYLLVTLAFIAYFIVLLLLSRLFKIDYYKIVIPLFYRGKPIH